jgi:hypothetical protein
MRRNKMCKEIDLTIEEYELNDELWTVYDYFLEFRNIKLNPQQCASISRDDDLNFCNEKFYVKQGKYRTLAWYKKSLDTMDTDIYLNFTIYEYCSEVLKYKPTSEQTKNISIFLKLEGHKEEKKVKRGQYFVNSWSIFLLDFSLRVEDNELYIIIEDHLESTGDKTDLSKCVKVLKEGQNIMEDVKEKRALIKEISELIA